MEEIFFSITYPPIPITKVGPVFLSLHGVFAAIGFYFGASHALKLSEKDGANPIFCLLYTSPSPRDMRRSRMPSSA